MWNWNSSINSLAFALVFVFLSFFLLFVSFFHSFCIYLYLFAFSWIQSCFSILQITWFIETGFSWRLWIGFLRARYCWSFHQVCFPQENKLERSTPLLVGRRSKVSEQRIKKSGFLSWKKYQKKIQELQKQTAISTFSFSLSFCFFNWKNRFLKRF